MAIDFIIPEWDVPIGVKALSTTRIGGVSTVPYHGETPDSPGFNLALHVGDDPQRVAENRTRLLKHLPSEPVWLNQVHGNRVVYAEPGVCEDADASWTDRKDLVLSVMTADCLPVLIACENASAVAAVHCGWRPLAGGILQKTLAVLRDAGHVPDCVWLGPAIGPNAFEVGEDVRQAFIGEDPALDGMFVPRKGIAGKYLADLYGIALKILKDGGITHVSGGDCCTFGDPRRFYSFRRDGTTGRMASLVWITD